MESFFLFQLKVNHYILYCIYLLLFLFFFQFGKLYTKYSEFCEISNDFFLFWFCVILTAIDLSEEKKKHRPQLDCYTKIVMDFDSPDPDVEKEFPGLFASESAAHRKKDEDDCEYLCHCMNITNNITSR